MTDTPEAGDLNGRLRRIEETLNQLIEGNNTNGQSVLDLIKAVDDLRINFSLLAGYLGAIEVIEIDKFEEMQSKAKERIRRKRFEELYNQDGGDSAK